MKKLSAFTLIELMITIAIAAILLTAAWSGLSTVIKNNRVGTQAHEVFTALSLARSEAIKRSANISVCSDNNTTAWQSGWKIMTDTDSDCTIDAGDIVLREWGSLTGDITLTGSGGDDPSFITFSSDGRADSALTLTLVPPECSGDQARTISVSATGRPSLAEISCP